MTDGGPDSLEARRRPAPPLPLESVKAAPHLVTAATAAAAAVVPLPSKKADIMVPGSGSGSGSNPKDSKAESGVSGTDRPAVKWNTKNLGLRLAADAVSAASAAVLVAPVISIIDRSIMENASGRRPLAASLRASLSAFLRRPQTMLTSKPFALIFALYGGTYLTANTLDTATSTTRNLPPTHVTSGTAKFAASSAANIGLCIYKDQVFVRLFGPPGAPPRPVALPSYVLFAARDCLTIFASFNVPHLLAPALEKKLGDTVQRYTSAQTVAQFAAPAAVQLFSTPVHLLGLDMYNRPGPGVPGGLRGRVEMVARNWAVSTAARICRIIPAFGVGGVVNVKVRRGLMERLA